MKKNGERCKNFAGYGTAHLGTGTCKFHLGNSQKHIKKAVRVEAERKMAFAEGQALLFGQTLKMDPTEALLWTVHLSASHSEFLRQEIAAIAEDADGEAQFRRDTLLRAWNDERDRLARTSKMALDAGVAERQVQLYEQYGETLAILIQGILGDLSLSQKQEALVPDIVRRHLVAASSATPEEVERHPLMRGADS